MQDLLYTIRDFYEVKNKKGIIISLSARDAKGNWQSIKAYVPYYSMFDGSAIAEHLGQINGQPIARICIPTERKFENRN